MQSGAWVDSQGRYDELVAAIASRSRRRSGERAGGRSPTCRRTRGLDGRDVVLPLRQDLRPPEPGLSRSKVRIRLDAGPVRHARPAAARAGEAQPSTIFSEVDLVSSTRRGPHSALIDWSRVGDGSIFNQLPSTRPAWATPQRGTRGRSSTRFAHCSRSSSTTGARTSCSSCWATTSLRESRRAPPGHDVPISVIAHDPAVMRQIAGWNWVDGMRPSLDGADLAHERFPEPLLHGVRLSARRRRREREVERVRAPARLRLQVADVRGGHVYARRQLRGDGHAAASGAVAALSGLLLSRATRDTPSASSICAAAT